MSGPWEQYAAKPRQAEHAGPWDRYTDPASRTGSVTDDMSGLDQLRAGAGKAIADTARGVGQLARKVMPDRAADAIGLPTQADIDESKALDAPLMRTGAGRTGNVLGNVALAVPTVAIPGAATLKGAAATGAGMGFLQPVASDESRLVNTAAGGVAGAGGVVLGRGLAAVAKGARALVEPFTDTGRNAIAGRTLQRFGLTDADLAGLSSAPTITGARTTLAEQVARTEGAQAAARLQDSVRTLDPEIAARFAGREVENNAARVGTLRDVAGVDGARDFAAANRAGTAGPMYQDAFKAVLDKSALSPAEKAQMTILMRSPDVKQAMKQAQNNLLNQGGNPAKSSGSVEGLHNVKLALDDMIAEAKGKAGASATIRAESLKALQSRLVTFIERMAPDYATARTVYRDMSKPINAMDTVAELLNRGTSKTGDLAGNPRLMPDALARAAADPEQLIKQGTGRRDVGRTLGDLLEPDQLARVNGVLGETDRAAAVARAANGPGSATAQRMASTNVLRQLLGPTGLPQTWAESAMLGTVARPLQFGMQMAEPRIQQVLADLMMNPAQAQAVMLAARTAPQRLSPELRAALPYLEQAARASTPAVTLATMAGQR